MLYIVQDQVYPSAPSLWYFIWVVCVSVDYTRCSGRTSVNLFDSSLQNLAGPQDLYFSISVPAERSCWRVSRAESVHFCWRKLLCHFSSSTTFPFYSSVSIGWYCGTGVVGLIWCRSLSLSHALSTSFKKKIISQQMDIENCIYISLLELSVVNLRTYINSHILQHSTSQVMDIMDMSSICKTLYNINCYSSFLIRLGVS